MQLSLYLILNLIWALNYVSTQSWEENSGEYPDSKAQLSKEDSSPEEQDSFYFRKSLPKPSFENQSHPLIKVLAIPKPLEETRLISSENAYEIRSKINEVCKRITSKQECLNNDEDKQWRLFYDKCTRTKNIANLLTCGVKFIGQDNIDDYNEAYVEKRNTPKRLPFHSWGGKRTNQVGTEKIQASRVPFNAWGGKRTYKEKTNNESFLKKICCIHLRVTNQNIKRYKDNYDSAYIDSENI